MNQDDLSIRPETIKKFHDFITRAGDLQKHRDTVQSCAESLAEEYNNDVHKTLSTSFDVFTSSMRLEQRRIIELFDMVESMIAERESAEYDFEPPKHETLKQKLDEFLNQPLPQKSAPYGPLCGAIPFPSDRIIPSMSYACIPIPEPEEEGGFAYILGLVLGFNPEKLEYTVCDADPTPGEPVPIYKVPVNKVVPVPISAPSRRNKMTNYSQKERVYALWPEGEVFTTTFYPASVASVPNSSPWWYRLKFDGTPPLYASVPEKFIVKIN